MKAKIRPLFATPWASVRGGKWHRTATLAQNFRDPVKSLCGVEFEPLNVQESKAYPEYTVTSGVCQHCLHQLP